MNLISEPSVSVNAGASTPNGLRVGTTLENHWTFEFRDPDGNLIGTREFDNLVTTAGLNDNLTQYLKGSAYTAAFYVGLIVGQSGVVTAITKANPGSVSAPAHGLSTGQVVKFASVGGMTQLNGNAYPVTVVDANTFTIGTDTSGFTTYTSGGAWTLQPGLAADTMSSHANWTESTAYSETVRQTLTLGSASGGSIDNTASKAVFTVNANGTVLGGGFVATNATKGGTTGVLYGLGAFSGGNIILSAGSTVTVAISLTAVSG